MKFWEFIRYKSTKQLGFVLNGTWCEESINGGCVEQQMTDLRSQSCYQRILISDYAEATWKATISLWHTQGEKDHVGEGVEEEKERVKVRVMGGAQRS